MIPEKYSKIAILSSENSWIAPYTKELISLFENANYKPKLFFNHKEIEIEFEIVFILGYTKIIEKEYLIKHKHNLVIHESDLPMGKGWAPLFWQILEEKNKVPVVLFEASEKADEGLIYIKDYIQLEGHELNDEIRQKQGKITIKLCLQFLNEYNKLFPLKQQGKDSFYKKRTPKDSELMVDKTIIEQFNLLRTVNNDEYPAFFNYKGHKYILKIEKEKNEL